MKKYKDIRKELGTINYIETETKIKNDNINYIEIYKLKKKDKKQKTKSGKTIKKKITIQNETKNAMEKEIEKINEPEVQNKSNDINQIEEIINEKLIEETDKNEKDKKQKEKKKNEDEVKDEDKDKDKDEDKDEVKDDLIDDETQQDGGTINPFKKRIYITDLSVDKDKEMFQM